MKKSELKEIIKTAFLSEADFTNSQDDDASSSIAADYDPLCEDEDEDLDAILARITGTPVDPYMAEDLDEAEEEDNKGIGENFFDRFKKKTPTVSLPAEFNHNQPSTFPSPSADSIEKMISGKKPLELLDILFSVWDETIKINLKNTSKEQIRKFLNAIFSQYKLGKIEDREVDQYLEILQDLPNYDSEYFNQLFNSKGAAIAGPSNPRSVSEAEEEVEVDAEEETTDGVEEPTNDSIVVDKKIVSLSSLPSETRHILDSLETLRAQAEEFGDQKFLTQVGNTITFFTRDFVVAGDEPTKAKIDESLEFLKMRKLAGLLKEGEYNKALLRENPTNFPSEDKIKAKGAIGGWVTVSKDGKNEFYKFIDINHITESNIIDQDFKVLKNQQDILKKATEFYIKKAEELKIDRKLIGDFKAAISALEDAIFKGGYIS